MDTRQIELVVLALRSAALCGVAITAQHVLGTGVFAALSAAIVLLALGAQEIVVTPSGSDQRYDFS
jgi:predicted Co/Zn/Cd cation transporter (cation efflux family)